MVVLHASVRHLTATSACVDAPSGQPTLLHRWRPRQLDGDLITRVGRWCGVPIPPARSWQLRPCGSAGRAAHMPRRRAGAHECAPQPRHRPCARPWPRPMMRSCTYSSCTPASVRGGSRCARSGHRAAGTRVWTCATPNQGLCVCSWRHTRVGLPAVMPCVRGHPRHRGLASRRMPRSVAAVQGSADRGTHAAFLGAGRATNLRPTCCRHGRWDFRMTQP